MDELDPVTRLFDNRELTTQRTLWDIVHPDVIDDFIKFCETGKDSYTDEAYSYTLDQKNLIVYLACEINKYKEILPPNVQNQRVLSRLNNYFQYTYTSTYGLHNIGTDRLFVGISQALNNTMIDDRTTLSLLAYCFCITVIPLNDDDIKRLGDQMQLIYDGITKRNSPFEYWEDIIFHTCRANDIHINMSSSNTLNQDTIQTYSSYTVDEALTEPTKPSIDPSIFLTVEENPTPFPIENYELVKQPKNNIPKNLIRRMLKAVRRLKSS